MSCFHPALQTENSNEGHCNASQPHSSAFPPKPRRRVSRKRASASDRVSVSYMTYT